MVQDQEVKYAGFWIRVLAAIIDTIVLIPVVAVLFIIFGIDISSLSSVDFNNIESDKNYSLVEAVYYAISIAYITYFVARKSQATPGKAVLKIYIGNRDGSKLTLTKSFLRALGTILTGLTLGLGFLPVIFTKQKVSLHDWLCNTRVFRR